MKTATDCENVYSFCYVCIIIVLQYWLHAGLQLEEEGVAIIRCIVQQSATLQRRIHRIHPVMSTSILCYANFSHKAEGIMCALSYNRFKPFNSCSCKIISSSLSFTPYFCMCMCNCWCAKFEHSWVCMCNGACSITHRKLHTVSWKGLSNTNTLPSDFVNFKAMLCPNFVDTESDG